VHELLNDAAPHVIPSHVQMSFPLMYKCHSLSCTNVIPSHVQARHTYGPFAADS